MRLLKFKSNFLKNILTASFLLVSSAVMSTPALHESLVYNNASVEAESVSGNKVHQIVLSAPTRINNAPFIEKEQRVEGKKTVMLLRLDNKDSLAEAFAYYRTFINTHGSVAYSCENRGCGISSYWANSIFDERRLAGRDSDQYYIAGKIDMAGASYWVSFYLVTNALRQNLIHVSYIQLEKQKQNWENGYLLLPENRLPSAVIQTLKEKLDQAPNLKLYLAGYTSLNPEMIVSNSESQLLSSFQQLKKELLNDSSIPAARIEFKFVGPFHSDTPVDAGIWFRLFLIKP